MPSHRALAALLATLTLATAVPMLAAQPETPSSGLMERQARTGTSIRRQIATDGGVPFDKEWHELSDAQRQRVRDEYDALPADVEPPFPLGGLRVLYRPMAEGYQRVSSFGEGEILMLAYIDAAGAPTKLEVYKSLDHPRFMALAASTVMGVRYKPAQCQGKPCAMPFVVAMKFVRE